MKESELERMSHVLRSSLQGALLNLQALAITSEHDAEARATIQTIQGELLREARMLVVAFEVLSLELGRLSRVNLGDLVRRALQEHGIKAVVMAGGVWPDVTGDERLLALAVAHLARNACAATPPKKRAPEIRARPREGGVELVVRDWGRGFGTARPPGRAFSSSRPDHVAQGLLAVERIARLHGGHLSFDSSSAGTQARLYLAPRS